VTDQATSVFETPAVTQQQETQANPTSSDSAYANLLSQIKNETGQPKYDSVPKALEGLTHAQQYIPQLKTELQSKEAELVELRAKLAQQAQLEEVVSRLTANQNKEQVTETPSIPSGLDEQAVLDLLEQRLSQRESAATYASNTARVHQELVAKYGDKASEVVAAKAAELGYTVQELGELASKKPKVALALFNTQGPKGFNPSATSLNIPSSRETGLQDLKRPEKSLLSGATSKQQAEYMRQVKEYVNAKHGIVS
jgi:vacuolar-type H+-ATPase subunit I/STV1